MNENLNNNVEQNQNNVQEQTPIENVQNSNLGQTQVLNPQPEQPIINDFNNQNINNGFDVPNVSKNENKGSKYILIVVIALIIALIGLASYYFISNNNPVSIYRNIVKNAINEAFAATEILEDNQKATIALDLDLDLEDGLIEDDVLELINDTTLEVGYQIDKDEKQLVFMLASEYDKEDLLNADLYFDGDEGKAYLYAEDFFDKYLEIDDVEIDEEFNKIFEDNSIFGSSSTKEKAKKILIEEMTSIITKEDCYKEDGYYVFEINEKELTEKMKKVFENLADNKEFIKCFEDSDSVKDLLKSAAENLDSEYASEEEMKISIKKTLLTNQIEEVIVDFEDSEIEYIIDGDEAEFKAKVDSETILSGSVKFEKNRNSEEVEMTFKVPDVGKIGIEMKTKIETIKEIDKVKKSKVKNMNDLTDAEQQEIMTNIQDSKLYEVIEKFSGTMDDIYSNDYEDDYDYDYNYDEDNYTNSTTTTVDNSIELYENGKLVSYNVPSGYTLSYNDESYKCYEKGDIEVCVIADYSDSEDEYLNELDDTKEYFEKNYSEYQNMFLSNKISKTVNGQTFYYKNLNYDYVSFGTTKYYQRNYITNISGSDYYTVEVEAYNTEIPESDMEAFLTISY